MRSTVPGLSSQTLDNGLEVIVIENHGVPLVTFEIAVKSGAYVEPPELAGLSHLYEHMFFKGNRTLPNQERYRERLHELGASWNGTTGTERVNYYLTVPSENLRDAAVFMRDALLYPLFREQELARERIVVLGEFDRNEANPNWHLYHQAERKLWHRYLSRKVPLGDRAIIEKATREQMLTLKERYYVPNNTALLFGGEVDPEEAFALASELFGGALWPRSEDPHLLYPEPEHPPLERSSRIVVVQPVQTATLQMSWHGPGMLADTASTFAADVLCSILEQPTSRLHKKLVDSGLFDSVGLHYYSQVHTGPLSAVGITSADRLDRAHAALLEELEGLLDPGYFSDEELEFAKDQMEATEIYHRERMTEFIHSVSFWWATGGLGYFESYLDNLRRVSREDIDAFVRRYVQGRPCVTGLLLSEPDLARVELGRSAEVIRPAKGSSATALAAQRQELKTELFEVEGLRVLLRRNRVSEVVAARAFLDGGLAFAGESRAGLERLLLEVAEKASERYPKKVMARELTRLGAYLMCDAQPDFSTFVLRALKKNLAPSLELFLDALVHPALSEEEVALARERRLTTLGSEEQQPDSRIYRLALQAVYGLHPFALNPLGTRGRIAAVQAKELRELHAQTLSRSRMLLVVVGDVERDELERLVAPAARALPEGRFEPVEISSIPAQPPDVLAEERDLPTVYLEGSFPAPNVRHPDYPALYLGMAMLYDRLFEEIRTKRNLSYAPGALLRRRSANIGQVYVTSVEPNRCAELMFEAIRGLQRTPVSEIKLRNTATEVRTRLLLSVQTSDDIAAWLGDFELHGGGFARFEELLDAFGRVTPEEVRAAMERHVRGIRFAALGKLDGLDRKLLTSF
jgi:zinc protease